MGNGTIASKGAVLSANLVFDATHGLQQSIAFGTGGTLNLNLDGTGALGAGYKGTGTLRIADGVAVASTKGFLGSESGSTGTATVTGTGSKWTNTSDLGVGYGGSGTLNIGAGGEVSNTDGYLGKYGTGTAWVTGTASKWTNSGELHVGYYGSGTLNIQTGGQVTNTNGYLGRSSGKPGTATVTGTGSMWINSGDLYCGESSGSDGRLNISAGGQVSNTNGYLAYASGSTSTATVGGTGSKWTNSGSLYVGRSATGTLTIQSGGQVTSTDGYVSNGSTVTVTATGATWSTK